jgi:hypothetical protein
MLTAVRTLKTSVVAFCTTELPSPFEDTPKSIVYKEIKAPVFLSLGSVR